MEYLLVDGYNVINAWGDVFNLRQESLEDCRDRLLNMLSNYQGYKKIKVMVVFDAHLVKGGREKQESFDSIEIIYTKENETADNYIERFVHNYGKVHRISVVTSDYLEQTIVLSNGGIRVSPRELRQEISLINKKPSTVNTGKLDRTNTIMSKLDPELFEKLEKIRRGKF